MHRYSHITFLNTHFGVVNKLKSPVDVDKPCLRYAVSPFDAYQVAVVKCTDPIIRESGRHLREIGWPLDDTMISSDGKHYITTRTVTKFLSSGQAQVQCSRHAHHIQANFIASCR